MVELNFTSRQVAEITGLTHRQIAYWCKTDLVVPSHRTHGGHARYTFTDLIALKAAKQLIDTGVSVQRLRQCIQSLTHYLPTVGQPLAGLSLVVTGDVVLAFHEGSAFDALTGQEWVFPVAQLEREILRHISQGRLRPADGVQGELFLGMETGA